MEDVIKNYFAENGIHAILNRGPVGSDVSTFHLGNGTYINYFPTNARVSIHHSDRIDVTVDLHEEGSLERLLVEVKERSWLPSKRKSPTYSQFQNLINSLALRLYDEFRARLTTAQAPDNTYVHWIKIKTAKRNLRVDVRWWQASLNVIQLSEVASDLHNLYELDRGGFDKLVKDLRGL